MREKENNPKLRIAVLYGGRSAEHEVSILSATNVLNTLAPEKYDAFPIFVTREGQWLLDAFENGALTRPSIGTELCFVPGGHGRAIALPVDGAAYELPKIDIIFPVLHGLHGEDGAVQGLAEVARVALAGCGIPGSANALDKDMGNETCARVVDFTEARRICCVGLSDGQFFAGCWSALRPLRGPLWPVMRLP